MTHSYRHQQTIIMCPIEPPSTKVTKKDSKQEKSIGPGHQINTIILQPNRLYKISALVVLSLAHFIVSDVIEVQYLYFEKKKFLK